MSWKEELTQYERLFGAHVSIDWAPAVAVSREIVVTQAEDVEAWVRAMYALHNIVLEETPSEEVRIEIERILPSMFADADQRFHENAEYLFFMGELLHIAEWYFGVDERASVMEDTRAFRMHKKAAALAPGNLLYEWAWRYSLSTTAPNDQLAGQLAMNLVNPRLEYVTWLKSKGFPGDYVLGHVEASINRYRNQFSKEKL